MAEKRNTSKIVVKNLNGRGQMGDQGINGRIILKWILKKWDLRVWTGFIWLHL
jgi:hypothetical protein